MDLPKENRLERNNWLGNERGNLVALIWARVYIVLPILAGLFLIWRLIPHQRDDAYITYRFAANFAESGEIIFNQGGPWVEGFSSPVWFMLLSLVAKIGEPSMLPNASMLLGFISFLALMLTGVVMSNSIRAKNDNPRQNHLQSFFIVTLLATLPAACYYAATGLETLLFALVVLCFSGATAGLLPMGIGVAAGLMAVWVRPEGAWLAVAGVVQLWVFDEKHQKFEALFSKRNLFLILAPAVGFFFLIAVRWQLFESFLPNTYWAKKPELIGGLKYVFEQYATPWYGLVLLSGFIGGLRGGRLYRSFLAAGFSWIIASILEGGDWMPLGRMLFAANIMFVFAAGGMVSGPHEKYLGGKFSISLKLITLSLLVLIFVANTYILTKEAKSASDTRVTVDIDSWELIHWLQGEKVQSVGLVDIGEIGFLSRVEVLDFGGLTDPVIARSPGGHLEKQFDLDYLFEQRRPEAIVIRLLEPFEDGILKSSQVEIYIMQDQRFIERYSIAKKILPDYPRDPYYGLLIYRRNGQ